MRQRVNIWESSWQLDRPVRGPPTTPPARRGRFVSTSQGRKKSISAAGRREGWTLQLPYQIWHKVLPMQKEQMTPGGRRGQSLISAIPEKMMAMGSLSLSSAFTIVNAMLLPPVTPSQSACLHRIVRTARRAPHVYPSPGWVGRGEGTTARRGLLHPSVRARPSVRSSFAC